MPLFSGAGVRTSDLHEGADRQEWVRAHGVWLPPAVHLPVPA